MLVERLDDPQLIQPKLQKRQQKAPETANQAFGPPSGKEEGSMPVKAGLESTLPFSSSGISGGIPSDVSGRAVASVSGGSPVVGRKSDDFLI